VPSHFAQTTATSAIEPFVIHAFAPLSTQESPSLPSVRAHAGGIRAEVRLGQAEAADRLSGGEFRDPVVALFLRAVGVDRVHHQARLHGRERAQAGIAALELLHDQAVGDVPEAGEVVLLDRGAEETHLGHLRNEVMRKLLFAIRVLDDRQHFLIHEVADGLPYHQLLFGEKRIDIHVVDAGETGHGYSFRR
jgi:hypothetical protein